MNESAYHKERHHEADNGDRRKNVPSYRRLDWIIRTNERNAKEHQIIFSDHEIRNTHCDEEPEKRCSKNDY
jgi:hypothetical protein